MREKVIYAVEIDASECAADLRTLNVGMRGTRKSKRENANDACSGRCVGSHVSSRLRQFVFEKE
jgi:hypothetical protein